MSQDVPAFQALPGATPDNSAFIDLYFDPSVSLPGKSTVSITINGWSMRLSAGQFVRIAVPPGPVKVVSYHFAAFLSPKPRLEFVVQPGQVVPVFYRASILRGDPGALSIGKHRGMSRTEKGALIFVLLVLLHILIAGVVPMLLFLNSGIPEECAGAPAACGCGLRAGTLRAVGCMSPRRGTPHASGDRIPVPDGVEGPRP